MFQTDGDSIRIDVPVGLLLAGPKEIDLSVDRPQSGPLSVKLRLIPAMASDASAFEVAVEEPMLATASYSHRHNRISNGDQLDHEEYGYGD